MVRICWRRSRGLQVECVASGPRPYWMLLDVPVCHPGCQHLDTLFCLFSAGSAVPCRPASLPGCPGLPAALPFPTPWSKCSNLLVVNWQEQGGGGGGGVVDPVSVASAICGRVACIGRRRRTALMPACLARNVS